MKNGGISSLNNSMNNMSMNSGKNTQTASQQAYKPQDNLGNPMTNPMMNNPMMNNPMMGNPMMGNPMMGNPMMGNPMMGMNNPMMGMFGGNPFMNQGTKKEETVEEKYKSQLKELESMGFKDK